MSEKMQKCGYCGELIPADAMQEHTATCGALDGITERIFGGDEVGEDPAGSSVYGDDDEVADHPDAAIFGNPTRS